MGPDEKVAKAIWEAIGVDAVHPWEAVKGKPRAAMMGIARNVLYSVRRPLDLLKEQISEDAVEED